AIWLFFGKESEEMKQLRTDLAQKVPGLELRRITDEQFYTDFLHAAQHAGAEVRICYLAPYPPGKIRNPSREQYYQQLLTIIKNNPHVTFRRIVRKTPENEAWVNQLLSDLAGCRNAHIALLDDLPADKDMPLALSVQTVDSRHVWFVA